MTDTISTDPATLRDLAATLRMDEVRVCPHYLKLDLLADTYDAIAVEKEAQAAPPEPDGYLTSWHKRQVGAQWHYTEKPRKDWREVGVDVKPFWFHPPRVDDANAPRLICTGCGSVETIEELRRHPGVRSCCPERHVVDRFDVIRAYEAARTPRVYRPGESLGGGLVAVPEEPPSVALDAIADTVKRHGEVSRPTARRYWTAMVGAVVAALTEKGERS
jgi:hypothetical protein